MFLNREQQQQQQQKTFEIEKHESTFLAYVWANNLTLQLISIVPECHRQGNY